jgi:hypothetical protein
MSERERVPPRVTHDEEIVYLGNQTIIVSFYAPYGLLRARAFVFDYESRGRDELLGDWAKPAIEKARRQRLERGDIPRMRSSETEDA